MDADLETLCICEKAIKHRHTSTHGAIIGQLQATCTYDEASELLIEFRLDALWLGSADLDAIIGTTSCDLWMAGGVAVEVRFLANPVSAVPEISECITNASSPTVPPFLCFYCQFKQPGRINLKPLHPKIYCPLKREIY